MMLSTILAISLVVSGQWTLSDCINHALEHNISVKQSAIEVQKKEVALNTAKNRALPGVSGDMSENLSFGRGLNSENIYENANTSTTGFSLGAAVPIFQGFDIQNDVKMNKLDLAATTEELEKAKNDIRTAVAAAYAEILYDKEILSVTQSQVELDAMLVERISTMKANGKASEAELASQKSTLAEAKLSATKAANELKLAILELSQLLELESPEGFDIVSPPTDALGLKLLLSPEEIYSQAVEIKPEIKTQVLKLDYAKVGIAKAKGAYYPSLSLSGGVGTNYYTSSIKQSANFGTQLGNNFNQSVGLTLSIPIFSRMSIRNSVRTATLSFKQQQLKVQETKKALFKEIQQAYYNAVASGSKLSSSEEAASSADLSFRLTTEKYENGKASITDYNESKNRYLEAQSNFLKARYEYLYLTRLLDFYCGKELVF